MNRKTFAILAAVALALALVAFLAERGGDAGSIAGASAGEPLVPGLAENLEAVSTIAIDGAGNERLVTIERIGGQWQVAEQDGYPADPGKVNGLLIALAETRIVEEKTADPNFHQRLGVEAVDSAEATGLQLTLTADGGERFELVLGDAYGSDERYARLAASPQSVLIDRNPDTARDPSDWVEPAILAIPSTRVQRVEIVHGDGERLVLRKDARELTDFTVESIPEGRELQYAGIANVTGSVLQNLNLEDVSRAPETAGEPLATTEFRTFDGLVVTVTATAAEEADGEPWLGFAARFDAAQASAFVPPVEAEPDAEANADAGIDADAADAVDADPNAAIVDEAEALNAKLSGWRFRIPAYQYSQMTRQIEDLLRAPPAE